MSIKVNVTLLAKILLLVVINQVTSVDVQAQQNSESKATDKTVLKTNLQDKSYRQALYYYFQGSHGQALAKMEQSKAKLTTLDSRSALFEAGLQLSAGLLQQAKTTLANFDALLKLEHQHGDKKTKKANELRLIALLSLSHQYLSQGDVVQAKDTLAKITSVSSTYYQEYHVLNQLAYWSDDNTDLLIKPQNQDHQTSAYIQLNDALRLIDSAQFELAISALQRIKITTWYQQELGFWKALFINEAGFSSESNERAMANFQGKAIQDYAQLLLAQIYISQERYNLAFSELNSFPEQSPYAESALFLFAFASQQVQQYSIAFNLLNLHYKKYPYSQLAWQSAELLAQQVSEQQSLAQGVSVYQTIENFFLLRQQELTDFARAFNQSNNLVEFSALGQLNQDTEIGSNSYFPESIWLQQALLDAELASLYQGVIDIDAQISQVQTLLDKTMWLSEIITLNLQRKENIISAQATREQQKVFHKLTTERDRLAQILNQQLTDKQVSAFANEEERQWLKRIESSHGALTYIANHKNTSDYKERLTRVEAVLYWQLAQQYPERAWQHRKQLQKLDNALAVAAEQQQQIDKVSNSQSSLEMSINKHHQSEEQLKLLLAKLTKLRVKISVKIKQKVNHYIAQQSDVLTEHLLTTRQGMANVLERMADADKRLSIKLVSPSNIVPTDTEGR